MNVQFVSVGLLYMLNIPPPLTMETLLSNAQSVNVGLL
jgi:hypothetical protein